MENVNNKNVDNTANSVQNNPLAFEPVGTLLRKFAIPSIVAMLVTSTYVIIDQLFIGNFVGELGNAATNIVFPLITCCIAAALLFGIGGSSAFNLSQGRGENERAPYFIGTSVTMMIAFGVVIGLCCLIFTDPILKFLGSPDSVMPYASEYLGITAIGFPALVLQSGGGHLVRADGSPRMTMIINLVGAAINIVLDAIFVAGFGMGMAGAAVATVISQYIACLIIIIYMMHFKSAKLHMSHFVPKGFAFKGSASLGMASFINQLAMMVTQIIFNNSLKYYGAQSIYGDSIPIAAAGIVIKVAQLLFGIIIGIAQGLQPIVSFNYGAKNYERVKRGYTIAIKTGMVVSVISFAIFQIFPEQILEAFGKGSDLYIQFGVMFFRITMFLTFLMFMQPISSNFFSAIGKPIKGVFLSLTRQFLFLIPLILVLPRIFGFEGLLYAQPIADFLAVVTCTILIVIEFHKPEFKDTESFFVGKRKRGESNS